MGMGFRRVKDGDIFTPFIFTSILESMLFHKAKVLLDVY